MLLIILQATQKNQTKFIWLWCIHKYVKNEQMYVTFTFHKDEVIDWFRMNGVL